VETNIETIAPMPETGPEPAPGYTPSQWAGLLVGPLILVAGALIPAPEGLSLAAWRTAAIGLWMAVWWMTEAIPIAVTSLLPLVLFPVLGILSIREAAAPFANPLIFLFLGGFLLALAMERWGLHRRLSLNVIRLMGTRPTRIIAGFMVASAFLSMWISNTATTMMMMPIGLAVIGLVGDREAPGNGNFAVALMLGIAYACSIGGVGTLIGTPTNAVLAAFMDETYGIELSFARWMAVALPLVVVGLAVAYWALTRWVYPIRLREIPGGHAFIHSELRQLGRMTRPEKTVTLVFLLTALLWITRPLFAGLVPGISDAGIALMGALLLFLLPSGKSGGDFVLNWNWARRLPWGVLLLFGGGLSLASAVTHTGLSTWIGVSMHGLKGWPVLLIVLLVVLVIIVLTELTSNTATAAAFLPVLAPIAAGIGQNPLLLLVPATLAASCAFMLPVATPPNAIVYGSTYVSIKQMARAGIVLNLLFILLVTALAFTVLPSALDVTLGIVPDWSLTP